MTLERCDCENLKDAVEEGVLSEQTWAKEGQDYTFYSLNHPSGDTEEGLLILFCPFCGRVAGDTLGVRGELWGN